MKSIHVIIGGFIASILLIFLCISVNAERYYIELGLGEYVKNPTNSIEEPLPLVEESNNQLKNMSKIVAITLEDNLTKDKKISSIIVGNNNSVKEEKDKDKIFINKNQKNIELEENKTIATINDNNLSLEKNTSLSTKIAPMETTPLLIEKGIFKYDLNSTKEANLSTHKIENPSSSHETLQDKISILLKNKTITFTKNSGRLRPSGKKILDKIAKLLLNKKHITINIEGHTDAGGKRKINQKISQMRANRVRRYLIKKGILATTIKAKGWGESKLLFPSKPYNHLNRRVEIYIEKEKKYNARIDN